MSEPVRLHPADIEAIARRVVELQGVTPAPRWVDAATAAEILGVSREYVYRHADELGAERLPSEGGQGRLRFDASRLAGGGADCTPRSRPKRRDSPVGKPGNGRRTGARKRQNPDLLPIKGRRA